MQQYKRIELIIEKMAYKRAGRIFEASGMTGYTVVPALAGSGKGNRWSRDTDISSARDMVVMISVGDEDKVAETLKQLADLLGDHIGIVSVSVVDVLRPDRF